MALGSVRRSATPIGVRQRGIRSSRPVATPEFTCPFLYPAKPESHDQGLPGGIGGPSGAGTGFGGDMAASGGAVIFGGEHCVSVHGAGEPLGRVRI